MIGEYSIVREDGGFVLLARDQDDKRTVVAIDHNKGQVYDVMPGDAPRDGGSWCARICTSGVDYVASFYSRSYANRIFQSLTVEEDEYDFDFDWTEEDEAE